MHHWWLLAALTACGRLGFAVEGDGPANGNAIQFTGVTSTAVIHASTVTVQHDVSGPNPILFVVVATRTSTAPSQPVQTVTFSGVSLHPVIKVTHSDGLDDLEVWALEAPPLGPATTAVTLAGTAAGMSASAVSYRGVDQTTPVDTSTSSMGDDVAISVELTTTAASTWVLATCFEQGNATQVFSPAHDQVGRWSNVVDSQSWESQCGADQPANAAATHSAFAWTVDSTPWLAIAVAFKAACPGC